MREIVDVRQVEGAEILDGLNGAYIAERFFKRSRSWFTQRLNNNKVNGKPISFTPEELLKLRLSLKVIASEITKFSSNIPNLPTDMSFKVYVITDPTAIEFMKENDLEGFKAYLSEEEYPDFGQPAYFDSEAEALAFCAGIGYGADDRNPERYPLRSCEPDDVAFIEAIENI